MSDQTPDPIDRAYVEAEALLTDEEARAARRARVLGAVASEPVAPPAPVGRPIWRRGGWLAAACVAGLTAFVVVQNYRPVSHPPGAELQAPPAAPIPAPAATAAPPAPKPPPAPVLQARPAALPPPAEIPRPAAVPLSLPPPPKAPAAPVAAPPPAPEIKPSYRAAPAPPPPPPPEAITATAEQREAVAPATGGQAEIQPQPPAESKTTVTDMVVTARKRQSRIESEPAAVSAYISSQRDLADQGASLRAAAAAGQVKEVDALLAQRVPVDAPDADGDTALIDSIRADHPAVAALLRRHGASLDHKNHAGESARDLAAAKGDADLDKALGVKP